jgi:dienelactone hydrolase
MARKKNVGKEELAARQRESGQPGGGQGRKDEVGRSGVYPMSGPHPPGRAEIRTAGAWGQGERGAAGYEDHGSSQLTYEGGQLLGALDTHGDSLAPQPEAVNVEIPPEEWIQFLNSFSRQHQGWLANVTITTQGEAEQTEVREYHLEGVSADHLTARDEIYISFERGGDDHITHSIRNPMKIIFERNLEGAHEGLEVISADGTLTRIRFRTAALPKTLDGVLEEPHSKQTRVETSSPTPKSSRTSSHEADVRIPIKQTTLEGNLVIPADARGIVLFAHGRGSGRHSPRNRYVAELLQSAGFGTLLIDLLTVEEESLDQQTAAMRFDIDLLAARLMAATGWLVDQSQTRKLPIGYFGASTGAAAALVAAADQSDLVSAVVSRGGRPDLAGAALHKAIMPILLIVGERDAQVIELNRSAFELIPAMKKLEIVPGATHLFEEPGALESVAMLAKDWFGTYLARTGESGKAA